MPRKSNDYSNSVIYKIESKDSNIKDIYVGGTVNLKNRKSVHKNHYINKPDNQLYKFIYENGTFDNWNFIILENCNINSSNELSTREQYWIDILKPTLNQRISKFISHDGITCDNETNLCKTKFKRIKEREELILLRKKIIKLENILKFHKIDVKYDDFI
jgi:hypothetical protein